MSTNPSSSTTDRALPLDAGTWTLDPAHSAVTFSIRHLGLARVRGRFDRFDARLEVGRSLDEVRVEATIDAASIDTNNADRDAHLRTPEFLDVESHPRIVFRSLTITGADADWRMAGEVTILGKTHPFDFDVEFNGVEVFELTQARHAGFSVTGELNRSDFGLDFGLPAGSGILLGDAIKFELDLEFVESPE